MICLVQKPTRCHSLPGLRLYPKASNSQEKTQLGETRTDSQENNSKVPRNVVGQYVLVLGHLVGQFPHLVGN